MKVVQAQTPFHPVSIVLETPGDVALMKLMLSHCPLLMCLTAPSLEVAKRATDMLDVLSAELRKVQL